LNNLLANQRYEMKSRYTSSEIISLGYLSIPEKNDLKDSERITNKYLFYIRITSWEKREGE